MALMREIRRDPTTGDDVVLSTDRVARPRHLLPGRAVDDDREGCPFCPGHESHTPPTLGAFERHGRWSVRAFANKYPALGIEGALERRGHGPYDRMSGIGAHEVIVETPEHGAAPWRSDVQMADALRLARDRMRDLAHDTRFQQLLWFRNVGADAGASLGHPHAQLMATPIVPAVHRRMVKRFQRHLKERGRELMQDLLDADRDDGRRVLFEHEQIVAVCPWAPRAPFEVWLVPTRPGPSFLKADDAAVAALAHAMNLVLASQARALEEPPYNAVLYTAPQDAQKAKGFRWHVRILPRISHLAGFEVGSGGIMHGVPPEESARVLRAQAAGPPGGSGSRPLRSAT